jgi:hypothetical protein
MVDHVGNPQVQRETTDLRFLPVVIGLAVLAVSIVLAAAAANWVFVREGISLTQPDPPKATATESLPAPPRLESLEPAGDSAAASLETQLRRFGPTDDPQYVHVPIDQAIEHLATQLQSNNPAAERSPKSHGLVGGGEPNSGRLLRKTSP